MQAKLSAAPTHLPDDAHRASTQTCDPGPRHRGINLLTTSARTHLNPHTQPLHPAAQLPATALRPSPGHPGRAARAPPPAITPGAGAEKAGDQGMPQQRALLALLALAAVGGERPPYCQVGLEWVERETSRACACAAPHRKCASPLRPVRSAHRGSAAPRGAACRGLPCCLRAGVRL